MILSFIGGSLFMVLLLSQFAFRLSDKRSKPMNQWDAPELPGSMVFAGEKVPLDRWDVKERLEREVLLNYYSQGNILYLIKLANRNFPLISERLKANGVPDDFKYLCIAESNMQSWALSKAGALGYWQFMNGTAPGYGLETSSQVDERQDLEKATDAACKYFKTAYAKFKNWTAAAASYNCGMGGYNDQAVFQLTTNYYDLHLPEETNRYIFRILTFKYLLENAESLGFHVPEEEKYQAVPYQNLTIDSSIPNLAQFAREHGTTYKMLRLLNPWLKGRSLSVNKNRIYTIRVPQKSF
jgi:hypothetical protein